MRKKVKLCHKCGTAWASQHRLPGRTEPCIQCGFDLHCCLNCALYDAQAPNQCKSSTTGLVLDKEKANFCDEFEFADDRGPTSDDGERDNSRETWKKLFGE